MQSKLGQYILILFTIDKSEINGGTMLKDYEINKPVLETDRLIIRTLNEADVPDLKEWRGEMKFIPIGDERPAKMRKIRS